MGNGKSLAAAQFILDACREGTTDDAVTPMQLIKLVYVAHGYMLGRHGKPLLDEEVQAWRYGPVVPSVYHAVKEYRSSPVDCIRRAPMHRFDPLEEATMREVARIYRHATGVQLSSATHRPETPWSITWNLLGQNGPISNDLIEEFYRKLLAKPIHSEL